MRRIAVAVTAALALLGAMLPAGAQDRPTVDPGELTELDDLRLDRPVTIEGALEKLDRSLLGAAGRITVSIKLAEETVAEVAGQGAGAQRGQLRAIEAQQRNFLRKLTSADADANVIASTQRTLNAVFALVDGSALLDLAAEPEVVSIKRVVDYELALSETVPYIGGTAVHNDLGFDGSGVVVAVLDTGVDYTHASLGGPGTIDAYFQAYGENRFSGKNRSITDRYLSQLLFPTAKVIGGFDFVGERWPDGNLRPDPDPIDFDGHGTHVADITAGENGVAPGASIFAIKVCSSVSTSCSGIALIQAMDLAVDPDLDGDTSDHVDIINMSLGSLYGQAFDDDLSQAVENATIAGVLTVAASGNASDKPYVTDTPAAATSAISVAQTQVPSAGLQLLTFQGTEIPGVFQPWSVEPTTVISAPAIYGDGAGGNLDGCAPFTSAIAGNVVLVDRGTCNFTLKIKNIGDAGGVVGIIGLIDSSAPFSGGDGGDRPITIPGYMISQANAGLIKANQGAVLTLDPANQLPLVGQMVGSSGRGPAMLTNLIKPEIGAPGASVSAEVGTGNGTTAFGGTSGATPMISGSAALLMEAAPTRTPGEIKAVLINTAEADIDTDPFTGLAPIQRIGGGEVRVDRAARSGAAAWDAADGNGTLSFGFVDASEATTVLTKTVTVQNYSSSAITYTITPSFRYAADQGLGAVTPSVPGSVNVPANGSAQFDVTLTINGASLKAWSLNSGSRGANPAFITDLEFDGYVTLDADGTDNDIHLPWHVLPRKSGNVSVAAGANPGEYVLTNAGVGPQRVEAYTLFGVSEDLAEGPMGAQAPVIDLQFVGIATIPGGCGGPDGSVIQFVVNTHERQTHSNAPAAFEFDLDVNADGEADFAVFNVDFSLLSAGENNLSDGRNLVFAQDLATGVATAFFFTDHDTNSANTVLTVCASQIGGDEVLLGNPIGVTALAVDIYYQGAVTDSVEGITWVPGFEQFLATLNGAFLYTSFLPGTIPAAGSGNLNVLDFGSAGGTDLGLLVLHRRGAPLDGEAHAILGTGEILP